MTVSNDNDTRKNKLLELTFVKLRFADGMQTSRKCRFQILIEIVSREEMGVISSRDTICTGT